MIFSPAKLGLEDAPAIDEIASFSFSHRWSLSDYRYFLSHRCTYCYGVFSGEPVRVNGYLLSLLVHGDLDVISIAVSPALRRQGIAEALLRFAQKDVSVSRILLEVDITNKPAVKLYEKVGFLVLGVRKKYYDSSRDAYFMRWSR